MLRASGKSLWSLNPWAKSVTDILTSKKKPKKNNNGIDLIGSHSNDQLLALPQAQALTRPKANNLRGYSSSDYERGYMYPPAEYEDDYSQPIVDRNTGYTNRVSEPNGVRRSDHYGGYGYGHHGHGHGYKLECCPLVVDPLTLAAILGFLAAATALLALVISASLGRRKKRSDDKIMTVLDMRDMWINRIFDLVHHGRKFVIKKIYRTHA